MLARLLQLFGIREKKRFGLTQEMLDQVDIGVDEDFSAFDFERMMVEDGNVVAKTATIDNDEITPTTEQAKPSFENDKENLLKAGRCTSLLLIEYGPNKRAFGTAFFVGPSLLVTAGHVVAGAAKAGVRLLISTPGTAVVDSADLQAGRIPSIHCSLRGSLFSPRRPKEDIAILECGYTTPHFLPMSLEKLEPHSVVDIVGYPAQITTEWLQSHPGLVSADRALPIAEKLLPLRHLTVSRGNVLTSNSTVTYYLSSVRGMSGSCLLKGGKVYGVHIGQRDHQIESMPTAMLFTEPAVASLLRRFDLIQDKVKPESA